MQRWLEYLRETLWRARAKTCCFIAPLRPGLICLACINMLVAMVLIVGTANGAANFMPVLAHVQGDIFDDDPSATACILPSAVDLALNAVLLAAVVRRDTVLLGVFCCYILVTIFLSFLVYGLLEAVINPLYLFVIVLQGVYEIFLLILVRSMMVEVELNNASDKNQFIYNKDQGMVIIRDVESPPPRTIGIGAYPALPEPEMTTSITTLATLNEQRLETPVDSRFSTLNNNNTFKTSTLQSTRTTQDNVDTQRSATLPSRDTSVVHKPINTQRIGAIQSLAGPSTYRPVGSNTDTMNKETLATSTIATIHTNNKTSENRNENIYVKTEDKTDGEPVKKKRGIFSKAPKEKSINKSNKETTQPIIEGASTPKPETKDKNKLRAETENQPDVNIITEDQEDDDNNDDEGQEEKNDETPQKKKRGIFTKASKEIKSKKEKKAKVQKPSKEK